MTTLWSGRFDTAPDAAALDFGASFSFDRRLFEDDVTGSLAWARALAKADVLTRAEAAQIEEALRDILQHAADTEIGRMRDFRRIKSYSDFRQHVPLGDYDSHSPYIERMMQASSAMLPMRGNNSQICCPDLPNVLKPCWGAKQMSSFPCSWAICWPLVIDSGMGLPCISASLGL